MVWNLGLSCFLPSSSRSQDGKPQVGQNHTLEQNKTWLLADSGGAELTGVDPQSVHSSFRFSFCSQIELETMNFGSSNAATVLMVNLDDGLEESRALEQRCRRIESLEKSISPLTSTSLIRFTYSEILYATRHFSKGIIFTSLPLLICLTNVLAK